MSERIDTEIFGDDDEQTYRLTHSVQDRTRPVEITLKVASGEIDVVVTDGDALEVTVTPEGGSYREAVARVSWDGQRLEVRPVKTVDARSGIARAFRGSNGYDVAVQLPRSLMTTHGGPGVIARLDSASGDVRVADLTGELHLDSASGELGLDRVSGRVRARTASGGITVDRVQGALSLATASGDVSISAGVLDELTLNATSGDLNIEAVPTGRAAWEVVSVSGDLFLGVGLAAWAGPFGLEVQTVSGSVEVMGLAERRDRRRWRLGSGDGPEVPLRVRTVSGDVSVDAQASAIAERPDATWTAATIGATDRPGRSHWRDGGVDLSGVQATVNEAMASVDEALSSVFGRNRPDRPSAPRVPSPPAPPSPPTPPTAGADPDPGEIHPVATDAPRAAHDGKTDGEVEPATAAAAADPLDDRLLVLQRIERGEISVEEGMALLDGAGQPRRATD